MPLHHENPLIEVLIPPSPPLTPEQREALAVRYETELEAALKLAFGDVEPLDPLQRKFSKEAGYTAPSGETGFVRIAVDEAEQKAWLFARRTDQATTDAAEVLVLSRAGIFEAQHPASLDQRQNVLLNIFAGSRSRIAAVK